MIFFKKYLPAISFLIGITALTFQTTVLYPWHNDLDREFRELKELKQQQDLADQQANKKKLLEIQKLEQKINLLIKKHEKLHHKH